MQSTEYGKRIQAGTISASPFHFKIESALHLRSDMLSVASKNSASLQAAISRRGRDAFAWSPIEWGIPETDINTKEAHYIRFFDSLHPLGFNLVMTRCAPKRNYSLVDGISLDAIDEICKIAESDATTQSLRDASLVRLMSECLLRPSEACAVDVDHLRQGGLWVLADDTLLLISDHTIDLIERYRKKGGIEEGSLFRRVRRGDNVQSSRLTPASIKRIVQNWAHRVGIQGNIGGYSVLVGTIGSLLERGDFVQRCVFNTE